MHMEGSRTIAEEEAHLDSAVLGLLIATQPCWPWSMAELKLQVGDPISLEDAVARLHGDGLVHRTSDGFVFPTRAAIRAQSLG